MSADRKAALVAAIVARLEADLAAADAAAQASYAGAIAEENQAEHQYDTRAIEASYLAGAQARRVGEIREMIAVYKRLAPRSFGADAAVGLTALVTLESDAGVRVRYFMGPVAGGLELSLSGERVVVITARAPLGRQLMGKEVGDSVTLGGDRAFEVVEIA